MVTLCTSRNLCVSKQKKVFLLTFLTERGNYFSYFILAFSEFWREQIMGMEKILQCISSTVILLHSVHRTSFNSSAFLNVYQ